MMAGNPVELPKFCFKTGTIQDCPGHGEHAYTVPARVREGERERETERQTDRPTSHFASADKTETEPASE